jgi:hypothetical protein
MHSVLSSRRPPPRSSHNQAQPYQPTNDKLNYLLFILYFPSFIP